METLEMARVPLLGQKTKGGNDHAQKLEPVHFEEDREVCARARTLQKFGRHGIARNQTGTTIRPNDEDGKRSHAKISTGELSGGQGNLRTHAYLS